MELRRIVKAEPEAGYRLRLTFDGGVSRIVGFQRVLDQGGVFARLGDPGIFEQVTIGDQGRTLVFPGDIDFCADALWLEGEDPGE